MKTHEIHLGSSYSDGRGNVRKVVSEGPQHRLYPGQADTDCVRYRVVARVIGLAVGTERNTTRNSFAQWAKEKVETGVETGAETEDGAEGTR